MRLFLIATLLLSAPLFGANAQLENCKVVKVVDDNVFEEGLSTYEYPDIDVVRTSKGLEVSVGANRDWEQAAGDFIFSVQNVNGNAKYQFHYKGSSERYRLDVTAAKRRTAKLYVKEPGESEKLVAIAYCSKR